MGSIIGNKVKVSIFGQSHSPAIGVTVDGLPPGFTIDMEELQTFLERRAPGRTRTATARKEADKPEFIAGVVGNTTCGAPLTALIFNENQRSTDYDNIRDMPRPGHADYTAHVKYGGYEDVSGGGHFSARLTAPLCIAGGIAKQMLAAKGIDVTAEILEIGGKTTDFEETILEAKRDGDSVGGIIQCKISGMPVGAGDPIFDNLEGLLAKAIFGIPAVKGIEFGAGFAVAKMRGSENNDPYTLEDGKVRTKSNNSGGILGGISNGEDIVFRAAFKPTPSIAKEQDSISYSKNENGKLVVEGRHDPCIVPRAVPVVEAAAAITILDILVTDGLY